MSLANSASHSLGSPLNLILERFANLEKTLGHMLAVNESETMTFITSDTPISKLLSEEIPAVINAKKDLEQLCRRQENSKNALEKEQRKLDKMSDEETVEPEALSAQRDKKDRLAYELENLNKDVALEQDKLTSTLLTLTSRENRYAQSVFDLMRIKKQFYENAYKTIEAELPNLERILQETTMRPVFGERLEDHLFSTNRTIAFPIALTVRYLLDSGLSDEGLFRISPKQIKLDKVKAHIDAHEPLAELLLECDPHLYSSLLKSYLRELPVPLLTGGSARLYEKWISIGGLRDSKERAEEIRNIFETETDVLSELVIKNIQYLTKFLNELSSKSGTTKMTPRNISIVLGPTLIWSSDRHSNRTACVQVEQANLEGLIAAVATLIEEYHVIFDKDIDLIIEDEDLAEVRCSNPYAGDASPETGMLLRPLSLSGSMTSSSTNPLNKPLESPSPNHKRKASIRTMGKNFMAKIAVPTGSSSSSSGNCTRQSTIPVSSPDETRKEFHNDQLNVT